jgi:hypothetical protein
MARNSFVGMPSASYSLIPVQSIGKNNVSSPYKIFFAMRRCISIKMPF